MIYFDNAATTQVDAAVAAEVQRYMTELYANPSGIHLAGQAVRKAIQAARSTTAGAINAYHKELIYTASGTEATNIALFGAAKLMRHRGRHIITSAAEHKATLNTCHALEALGFELTVLPVDSSGAVSIDSVKAALRDDTILVSLMLVNNETGAISPIRDIATMLKPYSVLFHTDAVQALGKLPIDVAKLGVDMLSFSGHKIHAPKGIGGLFVCEELRGQLTPLIYGGGQEGGLRSGTENTAAIMGLAKACELFAKPTGSIAKPAGSIAKPAGSINSHEAYIAKLRDGFEAAILQEIPAVKINAATAERVCAISSVTFSGINAETLMAYVPELCFSLGSACAGVSGQHTASHVLSTIGLDIDEARATARFSFSRFNTEQEVCEAVNMLKIGIGKLRNQIRNQ